MSSMVTPIVRENLPARRRAERDDFGDEPARRPRLTPYHRASQRELVRMSVELDYAQHDVYPNRKAAP